MRLGVRLKLLIFAALVWAVIFGVYSVYIYKERTEQTRRMALTTANLLSREIIADRQFYTSTIVKRALEAGFAVTKSYQEVEKSFPLPTTFLREVAEGIGSKGGFYVGVISLNPVNPAMAPADEFQREALERFHKGAETSHYIFAEYKGKQSLRYLVPDTASSQTCVDCHNGNPSSPKRDYKIGDVMGAIEITLPIESEMSMAMADIWRSIGYGFIVVVSAGLLGLVIIRKVITGPILNVAETARHLAQGDLTGTSAVATDDEIGDLAARTNEVIESLHTMIGDIRMASIDAAGISSRVSMMSRFVLEGSNKQGAYIDNIVSSMDGINSSVTGLSKAAGALAKSVEKGGTSALEVAAGTGEVVESMESLSASADETARSTKDMSFSIKDISENVENLSSSIMQVSSSMVQINAKIKEVETSASEAYKFADDVIRDARGGMESVESTISGIVKIKEVTREASDIMANLSERVKEIGKILDVIRGVAEETNLLAVNAAIIAAQSGEHGKSFSIVANEIKDLAERTSTSAKEVSEIIQAVEIESGRAGSAMGRGVESVEDGVRLAMEAGEGLKKIVDSAQRSTNSVREIARASADQAKESRMVVDATEKVADMTRRIVSATQEQARGSELVNKASERMSEIAYKVKGSAGGQVNAASQITAAMEEVNKMVVQLNNIIRGQNRNIKKVTETLDAVRGVSMENIDKAVETDRAVEEM
ncbi:MAG: DUF3365 domain-containing protein, partial [Deltaproteobacteria bacterium]|nr:DUF3365 domain-containing protein [Deltaproteobacteria bacterium]